jgi:WD40 repeat protein
LLATLEGHKDAVNCLAFSPGGGLLVTGSRDQTAAVWDVGRGMHGVVMGIKEHTLRGHVGEVTSLAFSSNGEWLSSGSEDGAVRLWSTSTWRCEATFNARREGSCRVAFSPNGELLAAAWNSCGSVLLWEIKTREEYQQLHRLPEEDSPDLDLAFSPDGSSLAVLSADQVRIWDLSFSQVVTSFGPKGVKSLAYSPRGDLIATGSGNTVHHLDLRLWHATSGAEMYNLEGHHRPVQAIAFSPDGSLLASGSGDATVNLWAIPTRAAV